MSLLFKVVEFLCEKSTDLKLTTTEKFVLTILAHRQGNKKTVFYKQDQLATQCGIKKRQLIYILNKLSDLSLIKKTPKIIKNGKQTEYNICINFEMKVQSTAHSATESKCNTVHQVGGGKCSTLHHPKCNPLHIVPSENVVQLDDFKKEIPQKNTPKRTIETNNKDINITIKEEDILLPDFISKESWEDYVAYRMEKKNPLSSRAKRMAIKQLTRYQQEGQDISEVIENSIVNGWTGLFPIRRFNQSKKPNWIEESMERHRRIMDDPCGNKYLTQEKCDEIRRSLGF